MAIIFYEYEHCKKLLENGVDKLYQRDLNMLAKYWEYEKCKKSEIEKNIIDFCKKNDGNFNEIQSYKMIKYALRYARKNFLRFPTPIEITLAELNAIKDLNDFKKEKFLFTMLVCAKFFQKHDSRKLVADKALNNQQQLYSNIGIRDIANLAGVKFTKKEWKLFKHELTLRSLISPTIVGSNRWAIGFVGGFVDENAIIIDDYRNPVAYYEEWRGKNIICCEKCGVKTIKNSNNHRMCKKCWSEKRKEDVRMNVKNYRRKL